MTQSRQNPPHDRTRDNVFLGEDNVRYHSLCMEDAMILYGGGIFNATTLVYFYSVLNKTEEGGIEADPDTPQQLGISREEFFKAIAKIIQFVEAIP